MLILLFYYLFKFIKVPGDQWVDRGNKLSVNRGDKCIDRAEHRDRGGNESVPNPSYSISTEKHFIRHTVAIVVVEVVSSKTELYNEICKRAKTREMNT